MGSEAYVGRASCGHVVFATVIDPEHARETAKSVGEAIRDGLAIERMSVEAVRSAEWCSPACPRKQPAPAGAERQESESDGE